MQKYNAVHFRLFDSTGKAMTNEKTLMTAVLTSSFYSRLDIIIGSIQEEEFKDQIVPIKRVQNNVGLKNELHLQKCRYMICKLLQNLLIAKDGILSRSSHRFISLLFALQNKCNVVHNDTDL